VELEGGGWWCWGLMVMVVGKAPPPYGKGTGETECAAARSDGGGEL
jgi:hypothetical protein